MSTVYVPAHALPNATLARLLELARAGLQDAAGAGVGMRYAHARLAALRAAAAIVAARAKPGPPCRHIPSVWVLLDRVAPELADWAMRFGATTLLRAAAEAGVPNVVTAGEADVMLLDATTFVAVVGQALGVAS